MDGRIKELIGGDGFELRLYEAALRNLVDTENKLRFNNFAYAMRELSRHILRRLAPDNEVLKCDWYKNLTDKKNGIARMQRAIYATQGGLSDHFVREVLRLDPDASHKALKNAIDELSRHTHIEEEVFDLSQEEVDRLSSETINAFSGLAEVMRACRLQIVDGLEEAIHESAVSEVLNDPLAAMDEIATHFSLEEVYVNSAEVTAITHEKVHILARGELSVTLQWGSSGDLRRGDGAELGESFDFTCELTCPVTQPGPDGLEVVEDSVKVDTGCWYDDPRDEEYGDVVSSVESS